MRNVFDQYTQPENRLTHALACTLDADRALLRPFLEWAGAGDIPPTPKLRITEQQVPGEAASGDGDEEEERGLPDACVFDENGWALLIEAKVQAAISPDQLRRHILTAKRHGFEKPFLLLLSVDKPTSRLPANAAYRPWREVYQWFRRYGSSSWSRRFTDYMETFESNMVANDYSIPGTITMFDGLRFDAETPFTYSQGKRLIRLLGDELQGRKDLHRIGLDPKGKRRTAITGRTGTFVWDFLPLKIAQHAATFTDFPHLTLALDQMESRTAITVPNGVKGGFTSKLKSAGEEGFCDLVTKIQRQLAPVLRRAQGAKAILYAMQRHYRSQRSHPETDARLDVDLRTILPAKRGNVKYQPEWVRAVYEALTCKRSNIEFAIQVQWPYDCQVIRTSKAADLFAESWIAMSHLLDFVLE